MYIVYLYIYEKHAVYVYIYINAYRQTYTSSKKNQIPS